MSLTVKKWYYLGGYFRDGTTNPCYPLYITPEAWQSYEADIQFHLTQSYESLLREKGAKGEGRLLDLAAFSSLEYEIWRGRETIVRNPVAESHLQGKAVIGGFRVDFWKEMENKSEFLPKSVAQWVDMGVGKVIGGFYQVQSQHVGIVEQLQRFLEDSSGREQRPATVPRKRIVMCIEMPAGWHDVKKVAPVEPPRDGDIGVRAMQDGDLPVYEWWYGDRPPQGSLGSRQPRGFWKRYHPKVCRRIEDAFNADTDFREGRKATDVDGVRYMIHRISEHRPFDYRGKEGSGHRFTEDFCITVEHPCYEPLDRANQNCFVQFGKGDPARRRPARRILNAADMARNAVRTGEPCSVCFSDEGELTGCPAAHNLCESCLRRGLRIMAGNIYVSDNLLCGCFAFKDRGAITALAERADAKFQALLSSPPADKYERMEFDDEVHDCRRQFDLGDRGSLPPDMYSVKTQDWFNKVTCEMVSPNFYLCSHPSCAHKVENWILRSDFDAEYRAKGKFQWKCPMGHTNYVLPSEEDIREYNKIILVHPEYYVQSCSYSAVPLRRRRFCKGCAEEGVLMIAEHIDACKHWPGDGRSHRHNFCFACARPWGTACGHGASGCADPGIQQLRKSGDRLEIGFVNGQEYLEWLNGRCANPPPTIFSSEPCVVDGRERQRDLGMEDKVELLKESQAGTSV